MPFQFFTQNGLVIRPTAPTQPFPSRLSFPRACRYSEQEWLEGDLDLYNVYMRNNTIVDPTQCGMAGLNASACLQAASHFVQVMIGLQNTSCLDNTFVADGVAEAATARHPGYCHPQLAAPSQGGPRRL